MLVGFSGIFIFVGHNEVMERMLLVTCSFLIDCSAYIYRLIINTLYNGNKGAWIYVARGICIFCSKSSWSIVIPFAKISLSYRHYTSA